MCQHNNFVIHKHIGILKSLRGSQWEKEINIVSWSGGERKYEIRGWRDNHRQHQNNGIRMTKEEVIELLKILREDTAHRKVLRASTRGKTLEPYPKPYGKNHYSNAYFVEYIGTFSESFASRKEVNLLIWDDSYHHDATGDVKYDLRWWDNSNSPYNARGVRLTRNEALEFIDIMTEELGLGSINHNKYVDGLELKVGDEVRHIKLGKGIVTKVDENEVAVLFPLKGVRVFLKSVVKDGDLIEKI